MLVFNRDKLLKLVSRKSGLLVDLGAFLFFFLLNYFYLWPYLGRNDESNFFSAPLIPILAYLTNRITGLAMSKSVEIVLSVFIVLAPISLYFFVSKLTERRMTGLVAAVIYSLPISWLAKERIQMAFTNGDGGHIATLAIIPLIGLFFLNFLHRGSYRSLVFASVGLGLVALMSPFGLLIGGMFLIVLTFSEFLQGESRLKIFRFLILVVFSIGLVAFYYHPGFVIAFLRSRQGLTIQRTFINLIPISFVVIPVVSAFGFLLFEKKANLQPLFVAGGMVILFSLFSFAENIGSFFPSFPRRYLSELGFSLSFLAGILVTAISDYLKFGGKIYKVQLNPLSRSLARKSFWLTSMGLMGGLIAFSVKSVWQLPQKKVLGLWDENLNTDYAWGIKHQDTGFLPILGWIISFLTIFLLFFGWLKISRWHNSNVNQNKDKEDKK